MKSLRTISRYMSVYPSTACIGKNYRFDKITHSVREQLLFMKFWGKRQRKIKNLYHKKYRSTRMST